MASISTMMNQKAGKEQPSQHCATCFIPRLSDAPQQLTGCNYRLQKSIPASFIRECPFQALPKITQQLNSSQTDPVYLLEIICAGSETVWDATFNQELFIQIIEEKDL